MIQLPATQRFLSPKLPFIVKGVLGVEDAIKCAEIGVKGIIVSHHHGRLPYAVPPMMVLPKIKKAPKAWQGF